MQPITNNQSGQTLIETVAAIFILVMALTVGLGLAVDTLAKSERNMKEVVAVNLAREGIELVRMMRDSNWLAGDRAGGSFDLDNCTDINLQCYPNVFTGAVTGNPAFSNPFNLSTPSQAVCNYSSTNCSRSIYIRRDLNRWDDPNSATSFFVNSATTANYGLYVGPSNEYDHWLPIGCGNPATCPPSYLRKIKLSRINTAPYTNSNSNWLTRVNVYVAWTGKGCNNNLANQDPETLNTVCKVTLEDRLTNWKDYR